MPTQARAAAAEPDDIREQLVKVATQLFLTRGYARVSVRDLAAACGLTTGVIYNRFRGKVELLVAALEQRIETDLESGRRHASAADINRSATETGLLEAELSRQAETYPDRAALRALLVEGAVAARRDAKTRSQLGTEHLDHLRWWKEIYRGWQRGQKINPDVDVEAMMMLLWAAELGLGVLEAYGIDPPRPAAWRRAIERVLRSLRHA